MAHAGFHKLQPADHIGLQANVQWFLQLYVGGKNEKYYLMRYESYMKCKCQCTPTQSLLPKSWQMYSIKSVKHNSEAARALLFPTPAVAVIWGINQQIEYCSLSPSLPLSLCNPTFKINKSSLWNFTFQILKL